MLLFKFISLTYICFVYSSLIDVDKQYKIYENELHDQPLYVFLISVMYYVKIKNSSNNTYIFSYRHMNYCYIQYRTLASYCLYVFRHLVNASEDYQQLYLNFIAFEIAQNNVQTLNANKCLDTNLMIPHGDKPLNVRMKHMICHRGPAIVRTDVPDKNQYYDDISIYISKQMNVFILQRIDRENHQLLNHLKIYIYSIKQIELPFPTPLSTFDIETIEKDILKGFEYVYIFHYNLTQYKRTLKILFFNITKK